MLASEKSIGLFISTLRSATRCVCLDVFSYAYAIYILITYTFADLRILFSPSHYSSKMYRLYILETFSSSSSSTYLLFGHLKYVTGEGRPFYVHLLLCTGIWVLDENLSLSLFYIILLLYIHACVIIIHWTFLAFHSRSITSNSSLARLKKESEEEWYWYG